MEDRSDSTDILQRLAKDDNTEEACRSTQYTPRNHRRGRRQKLNQAEEDEYNKMIEQWEIENENNLRGGLFGNDLSLNPGIYSSVYQVCCQVIHNPLENITHTEWLNHRDEPKQNKKIHLDSYTDDSDVERKMRKRSRSIQSYSDEEEETPKTAATSSYREEGCITIESTGEEEETPKTSSIQEEDYITIESSGEEEETPGVTSNSKDETPAIVKVTPMEEEDQNIFIKTRNGETLKGLLKKSQDADISVNLAKSLIKSWKRLVLDKHQTPRTFHVSAKERKGFADILAKVIRGDGVMPDSPHHDTASLILAISLEAAIYHLNLDTKKKYTNAIRSRAFNLGDQKNPVLRENLLLGVITPDRLANMTSEPILMKTQANISYEEIPEEQETVGPRVLELASRMRMSI